MSSNWQLRLPRDFKGLLCNEKGIFISSAWHPEDLDLIWLDYDGKLNMSTYVRAKRTKLGGGHYPSKLISAAFKSGSLVVHRAFFKKHSSTNEWSIDKEIEYIIPTDNSNQQLHRTP